MKKSEILRLKARDLIKRGINTKKITKCFNNTGIVIIENILNKNKCDFYINLLEKIYLKYRRFNLKKNKGKILSHSGSYASKSLFNLHNKDVRFLKFIDHPITTRLVTLFLQQGSYKNSDDIICQQIAARSPASQTKNQQLHNDARIVGSFFPLVVQVMWALDPFTKSNGATRFVIGSHRFMKFPQNGKVYKEEKVVEVPTGSVIIFNGSLWHGSSQTKKNLTRRWGLICRYARWFCKSSFDFQKNTPRSIYNKMNKTQRDLLGFRFNPPKDEFTGDRAKQKNHQKPENYTLPV